MRSAIYHEMRASLSVELQSAMLECPQALQDSLTMNELALDETKTTELATSCGVAIRLVGLLAITCWKNSGACVFIFS